jgi:outer membrane biosynthesis protein TonB
VLASPVVARSSGCREFDALAAAFVAQAEFAPARKGAGAVSAWTQLLVQPETLQ